MPTPTISPPNSTPPTSFGFGPRPSFSAYARTSRRRGARFESARWRRRANAARSETTGSAVEDAGLADRRAEGRAARGELSAATATTGDAAMTSIEKGG